MGWFANYTSWEEASALCEGYNSDAIVSKVLESTLAVKEGKAVFEQDSVLFDHIVYSWPVTTYLLHTALKKNRLRVLDFGGAIGTHYFQNRNFLTSVQQLSWVVVELPKMVQNGRQHIAHGPLSFASSLEEAYLDGPPDIILVSSVLPYLQDPLALLAALKDLKPPLIILDRTFISQKRRLCIQVVPPSIYQAVYPCWFLTEKEIIETLKPWFSLEEKFEALDGRFCKGVETFGYIFRFLGASA